MSAIDVGRLARALLWAAASTGILAWVDAFRLSRGAEPPVGAPELASLAAGSGALLLAPILACVAVAWLAVWFSSRGGTRRPWRDRPSPAAGILLPALGFWTLFIAVLARADYSGRWVFKAVLWGLAAGLAGMSLASKLRSIRPAPAWAAVLAALAVWTPAAVLPRMDRVPAAARAPAPAEGKPSFVLVVIDTLRADHLGAYGYARPTSPFMDELAATGARFDDAISPSSWTLPSMASIFTSIYPARHGSDRERARLPRGLPDLASKLREAGYRTGGFATNPWLNRVFGFDDGFEDYYDNARLTLRRETAGVRLKNMFLRRTNRITRDPEEFPRAAEVTAWARRWLAAGDGRPFFLYVHYMDVHHPYLPYPPYKDLFCQGHDFDLPEHELEDKFRKKKIGPEGGLLEHMVERYDEGIRAADDAIGDLVRGVEALGLAPSTTIVLTSDHGEEFYDHAGTGHRRTVYQEVVRVPLIVKGPLSGSAVIRDRVSTMDIFPAMLEWAGASAPPALAGASFVPILDAARGDVAPASLEPEPDTSGSRSGERLIGSQLFYKGRAWTALYMGTDKMIRILPAGAGPPAAAVIELYHLDSDPGELHDEAASEPERAAALTAAMESVDLAWGEPGAKPLDESEPIDEETLDKLRGLGYIK